MWGCHKNRNQYSLGIFLFHGRFKQMEYLELELASLLRGNFGTSID